MGYSYTKTVYSNTAGDVFRSKANRLASNQPQHWMVGETCMYGANGLKWWGGASCSSPTHEYRRWCYD